MEPILCEHCGSAVSTADLTSGHCPLCMVELGFEPTSTNTNFGDVDRTASPSAAVIDGYTILRSIGEGGMGVVYEAEQHHPRRPVAVKIIKAGRTGSDSLRRFEQEAHALGRLQHPNIARIYEAGTADTGFGPQPYFAMEFVRGASPLDYANAHRLKMRDRLELVAKIADGVHHAHQRGLIHRDLKPANILVDDDGQPKILDFGVARVNDSVEPGQTNVGQLVGTLAYMSPEQVSGDPLEIDTRTDVYALGVMLYELLAGRRPYDMGRTLHDAMRTVRETEPALLGAVDRGCRGDVETIAAKALEKDKSRRYGSAAELAADIRRYLRHEPIVARPASTTYQLQKFARRHRAIVIGVAATILALVGGVIVSSLQTARAQRAEHDAVIERDRARDAEQRATVERNRAATAEAGASSQRDLALRAEQVALDERNRAVGAENRARYDRDTLVWQTLARESVRYSDSRMDDDRAALLARQAQLVYARTPGLPAAAVEEALQRAARQGPWGHTLFRAISPVYSVAISRDDYLACACGDQVARIWDLRDPAATPLQLAGHATRVEAIAFADDGGRVASGDRSGVVLVRDLRNPSADPVRLSYASGVIHAVAFSPDGTRLAATNGGTAVPVWDLRNPRSAPIVLAHEPSSVQVLAFSSDGSRLATGGFGLNLWNMNKLAEPPVRLRDAKTLSLAIAFSPDGTRMVAADDFGLHVWDVSQPAQPAITLMDHQKAGGDITALAYSQDGSQLAASGAGAVVVLDPRKPGAPSLRLQGYDRAVMALSFSHNGRYLATGGFDQTLRVWDLKQDDTPLVLSPGPLVATALVPVFSGVTSHVGLAYSPDGTRLAAASNDPNVRVWNVTQTDAAPLVLRGHEDAVVTVAFSADGTRIASGGSTTTPYSQLGLYSLEGKRLADGANGTVRVWDLRTPDVPPMRLAGQRDAILAVLFSPRGPSVSAASADGTVRSWATGDPSTSTTVLDERSKALALAIEPYKRRLLGMAERASDDGLAALVKALDLIAKGQSSFSMAALSPDLTQLATAGFDRRTVRLWDLTNRGALPRLIESRGTISAVVWAPNSRHLAIGATSPNVQVWDVANLASPPISHGQESAVVASIAFSPDSSRLAYPAGRGNERGVYIWDWREPVKPPTRLPGAPPPGYDSLAFSPDGGQLAALQRSTGRIALWRLSSSAADYLCSRVWRNLTAEEWNSYIGSNTPYERTCSAASLAVRSVSQINVGRMVAGPQPLAAQPLSATVNAASGLSSNYGPGCTYSGLRIEGTRLTITAPLSTLISIAYGNRGHDCRVAGVMVGGPDWIRSEPHEIQATVPDGQPRDAASLLASRNAPALQAVLRTALEERFKLQVRAETRDIAGYALTANGRPALTPEAGNPPSVDRALTRRLDAQGRPYGDLVAEHMLMSDLVTWFRGLVGSQVDDRTGLSGRYSVEFEFDHTGVARPTLFAALQRIGLDLKPANLPMQVLVIDRAERPPGR